MRPLAILLALTVCAAAQPSAAQTATPGSNMPADFYPHSPCIKPQKVRKDSTARTSGGSAQAWAPMVNTEVELFNQRAQVFNACIKHYVDNANRDIERIQNIVRSAVADANAPVADPKGDFMTDKRR